ncbi:L,D-transpeptidase family protein [Acidimangrovimonas sediminis]|uniref:L,D-transpeptidase family protein n=1 Tax=Acidimangrovimonas sediminis TaxID=2056283 RepID=UPI000C7FFBCF|nr:L,D-transpeptidase family protein [Acidimangrovimonas sediminis]
MRAFRTILMLVMVVGLAACASKFKTYDGPAVTQILIIKHTRQMYLLHGDTALKTYQIHLGNEPVGQKHISGDGKTPEGVYYINRRNPNSEYYLSLGISYPDVQQVALAKEAGENPGGDIFIHGEGDRKRSGDWTAGCIAVTNKQIEEVYAMVQDGTPVVIMP